jgi:hypothetical protein
MLRWVRRCCVSLLILVDGALWFVACVSVVAAWQYSYAGLHDLSIVVLTMLALSHLAADIFPLRWFWAVLARVCPFFFGQLRDKKG